MSATVPITSRRDMLRIFETRLEHTQSDLVEDTRLDIGHNMLKTAIIESNITSDEFLENDSFEETFEIEDGLWMVEIEDGEESGYLFCDLHDDRFWILYSLTKSKLFNDTVDSLLKAEGGGLDRLWLPTGQVEQIGEMGEYEGVKISFGANEVFPEEFIEDQMDFTDLNIDGTGHSSRHLYDILKNTEDINDFLALSRVQIRREVDGEFVRESITNDGSFTTRGGSDIALHVSTVESIKNRYERLLRSLEQNHIIGAEEKEHGARSRGSPVVIKFCNQIADVERFLSYVVNAQDPFRLWGHTREVGENAYHVDGVDAHNGDKIAMEVSSKWLRLYLYGDACGNTALRLFTNLQQYYDPAAELVIEDA